MFHFLHHKPEGGGEVSLSSLFHDVRDVEIAIFHNLFSLIALKVAQTKLRRERDSEEGSEQTCKLHFLPFAKKRVVPVPLHLAVAYSFALSRTTVLKNKDKLSHCTKLD